MAIADYMIVMNSSGITEQEKQNKLQEILSEVGTVTDAEENYKVTIDGQDFLVDKENQDIETLEGKIVGETVSEVIGKITGTETENTEVIIGGRKVVIPAGFTISEESAETVSGGIVVVDNTENHNEWVWIPCNKYARYPLLGADIENNFSEQETESIINQKISVSKNKGYYIGRYEAGDKETTALGKLRGEEGTGINTVFIEGDVENTVVIKKNQAPYNYVKIDQSISLSDNFANENNYDTSKMFTSLCSSYAWDSALKFIEKTDSTYSTDPSKGNHTGNLMNTGLTTPICNIYDMDGNVWAFTTESYNKDSERPWVVRGGDWNEKYLYVAATRGAGFPYAYRNYGFRITLFLK